MTNPPEFCICGARRHGVQEGRTVYNCGTRGTEWGKKLKLERTAECFENSRKKATVQNPDRELAS